MSALAQTGDVGTVDLVSVCGDIGRSFICEWVYEWTGNRALAKTLEWVLNRPLRIVLVLMAAWFLSLVVKRAIVRFTKRVAVAQPGSRLEALRQRGPGRLLLERAERSRAQARAETLGHVLRGIALTVIWTAAALIVLGEVGVNLAPLIAGAGIGGIALGFGAQSMVKDFLSGLLMLIEDHLRRR